jgi:FkbM family methyltransferase
MHMLLMDLGRVPNVLHVLRSPIVMRRRYGAAEFRPNGESMGLSVRRWKWRVGRKLYMLARGEETNHVLNRGELRLQRLVATRLRLGSRLVVFDVGARIGDWSRTILDAASSRPGGVEIHVFEPVPDSRGKLETSLAGQISRGNVRVNPVALSDSEGEVPIYVPHFTAGTSTLHPDSSIDYEQVLQIPTTTVEEYCRKNSVGQIDLLKIDTEGNDLRVIQGATELLKKGRIGVLQFEYNHRWVYSRTYLKDVFDLVKAMPYSIAKICSSGLEVYVDWHPELERFFETNYALVHEQLTGMLDCETLRIGAANVCEAVPDSKTRQTSSSTPASANRA